MDTVIVAAILFLGGVVQSSMGFGLALVAMPLLALVLDIRTATPLVAMTAASIALVILSRTWRQIDWASSWQLVVSSIFGIPIGLFCLRGTYEEWLKMVLGLVIAGFSSYCLIKPKLPLLRTERYAAVFGVLSGILGGAYNTNGPPIVIYASMRRWDPERFRATVQGYFCMSGAFIILGHMLSGLWTGTVLKLYVSVLPAALLAYLIGNFLHHRIPKGKFDRYVHIMLVVIGLALCSKSLSLLVSGG